MFVGEVKEIGNLNLFDHLLAHTINMSLLIIIA